MPWIRLDHDLLSDPRIATLAACLGLTIQRTIGAIASIWIWALSSAPDGHLSEVTPQTLRYAAGLDATNIMQALQSANFVDQLGRLCNWHSSRHGLLSPSKRSTARSRKHRSQITHPKAAPAAPVKPPAPKPPPAPVIPNPIPPPPPNPPHPVESYFDLQVELPSGFPSTEADAVSACALLNVPADFIRTEWQLARSRGGYDHKNCPIRSWPHYISVRLKWQYNTNGAPIPTYSAGHASARTRQISQDRNQFISEASSTRSHVLETVSRMEED